MTNRPKRKTFYCRMHLVLIPVLFCSLFTSIANELVSLASFKAITQLKRVYKNPDRLNQILTIEEEVDLPEIPVERKHIPFLISTVNLYTHNLYSSSENYSDTVSLLNYLRNCPHRCLLSLVACFG